MEVSSPEDAGIIIQKLPCDMGIHRNPRKGTLNAPDEVLEGLEFEENVLVDEVFPDEFSLEETQDRIYENTKQLAQYGNPVVSVGGDHSISYPVLKALKQEVPDLELVWLDAHLDLKEKVGDNVSHDVVVRQLVDEGLFEPEEITFVGVTEIDYDEEDFLNSNGFNVYMADELSKFLNEHESDKPCYLSIDIDVLKESQAPGTGYTDGRLAMSEVQKAVEKLNLRYADLVEVAPPFDENNKTVKNAKKILRKLV